MILHPTPYSELRREALSCIDRAGTIERLAVALRYAWGLRDTKHLCGTKKEAGAYLYALTAKILKLPTFGGGEPATTHKISAAYSWDKASVLIYRGDGHWEVAPR